MNREGLNAAIRDREKTLGVVEMRISALEEDSLERSRDGERIPDNSTDLLLLHARREGLKAQIDILRCVAAAP